MKIENSNSSLTAGSTNVQQNNDVANDSVIKGLQKQIEQIKQKINDLPNEKLSDQEKVKKKQEYQEQIQQLNSQISQRMMELRNKQQEEKNVENKVEDIGNTEENSSVDSITINMLTSASASLKNIRTLDSVQISFEGKKRMLNAQIKMDGDRGEDTSRKTAELAKIDEKLSSLKLRHANELNKANDRIEDKHEDDNKYVKKDDDEIDKILKRDDEE